MRDLAELGQALIAGRTWEPLAIVAGSVVAAWLVDKGLSFVLSRWAKRTRTELDDRILEILHGPVRSSVVLVGLAWATSRLDLPASVTRHTLSGLATLAVLLWLTALIRLADLLLSAASRRFRIFEPRTLPLFSNLGKVLLTGAAIYLVLVSWSIDVTAWVASAGILGIAVGFAAKDTLANLFAGIFILADAPYKVGDYVNLEGGERGEVTHVGIRSTRLLTRDDIEITIPNSIMGSAKIVNESGGRWPRERLRIKVGVAYGSDVDQVRRVLLEAAAQRTEVCGEPAPRVRFRAFGNSSLDFELLVWIEEPVLRGRVQDALNTAVYKAFEREGIEIPYPKRDVYVRSLPAAPVVPAPAPPSPAPPAAAPEAGPEAE